MITLWLVVQMVHVWVSMMIVALRVVAVHSGYVAVSAHV